MLAWEGLPLEPIGEVPMGVEDGAMLVQEDGAVENSTAVEKAA